MTARAFHRTAMTEAEIQAACRLRLLGWTCAQIANYLGGLTARDISEVTK